MTAHWIQARTGAIGLAILAAAGFGAFLGNAGQVTGANSGPYQIEAQASTGNVWQVNTETGQIRLCLTPQRSRAKPECGIWSDP